MSSSPSPGKLELLPVDMTEPYPLPGEGTMRHGKSGRHREVWPVTPTPRYRHPDWGFESVDQLRKVQEESQAQIHAQMLAQIKLQMTQIQRLQAQLLHLSLENEQLRWQVSQMHEEPAYGYDLVSGAFGATQQVTLPESDEATLQVTNLPEYYTVQHVANVLLQFGCLKFVSLLSLRDGVGLVTLTKQAAQRVLVQATSAKRWSVNWHYPAGFEPHLANLWPEDFAKPLKQQPQGYGPDGKSIPMEDLLRLAETLRGDL